MYKGIIKGRAFIENITPSVRIEIINKYLHSFPFHPNDLNFKAIIGTLATSIKLDKVITIKEATRDKSQPPGKNAREVINIELAGVGSPMN
tara:strand:- start:31 stop:303 length:273 start_codon:yes stop_codon:yes gene_type:complete